MFNLKSRKGGKTLTKKNDEGLTKEQVYQVVEFARGLLDTGIYTPGLLNSNLLGLNITPKTPKYDKIIKALENARLNAKDLQEYSQWAEFNDMLYARLIKYYANMLSFDLKVVCKNAKKEDYATEEYKEDKRRIYKFLDAFDYRAEFANVVDACVKYNKMFVWFRTNKGTFKEGIDDESAEKVKKMTKYTLQVMPQDKCLITGYFEYGLLYDFDMMYFTQPGVDIEAFDPSFKRKARELFDENGMLKYKPTNPLSSRDGTYAYWVQTSPDDGAWCFSFSPNEFASIPFLAPILPNLITDQEMRTLQKDKDIESAYGLLMGEMEMLDKQKSGNVKDAFAVNPKTLGQLLGLVRNGLNKSIKVGALPVKNLDFYQYKDENPDMYSNQLATSSSLASSSGNMLFSTGKMSQEEARNAIINDSNIVARMYSQFNHFLEFYANKKTRKYKFSFEFEGINFPFEQEQRQKKVMDLANVGIVLPQAIGAAYGYKPQDFERMMEEASAGEFTENLIHLVSVHNASASEIGRPTKSNVSTESREYDDTN